MTTQGAPVGTIKHKMMCGVRRMIWLPPVLSLVDLGNRQPSRRFWSFPFMVIDVWKMSNRADLKKSVKESLFFFRFNARGGDLWARKQTPITGFNVPELLNSQNLILFHL